MEATHLDGYTPSPVGFPIGEWNVEDHPGAKRSGVVMARSEGHRLVIGSPGSGKFTSVIAPLLLSCDKASVIVFDVANGEAARTTAAYRQALGATLVLDPFEISGQVSGAFNPLDLLKLDSPRLLSTARRLTDALFVVANRQSEDSYWNDQAREVLTALLIHVATHETESGNRTLKRVREIIRRPLDKLFVGFMSTNKAAGGVVADVAANIAHAVATDTEKNTFYVMQALRANTQFLDLPELQKVTGSSTLSLRTLRERVSSLYVVVPEYELNNVGRWLRLIYSVIMEEMRLVTSEKAVPLHVIIDEFPAMGLFPRVCDDMALVRKFGIHMHVIVQSLAQLKSIYGDGWEKFTASAKFQQLLGTNDLFTAEYFSKRMGQTTKANITRNENRGLNNTSEGISKSWGAVPLMLPDEINRLPRHLSLCLVENEHPKLLRKWHFFEADTLSKKVKAMPTASEAKRGFGASGINFSSFKL